MVLWGFASAGIAVPAIILVIGVRQGTLKPVSAIGAGLVTAGVTYLCSWQWGMALDAYLLGVVAWIPFRRHTKAEACDRPGGLALLAPAALLAPLAWPALIAVAEAALGGAEVAFVLFLGSLAASSADLWASEIGVLNSQAPRDLVRGKQQPAGAAGAVSPLGLVAATAGGWAIGLAGMGARLLPALIAGRPASSQWGLLPLICTCAGLMGSVADSILGGIAQAIYHCPRCERATDQPIHHCGTPTLKVRGWRHLTNPRVDLIASMVGGVVALVFWMWLA
ncbi:MAG: DUF92 domain-containing protein [Anaerolineae bacterium]|jgi:uncharacterized membrane protein